jgi:hypothetical protein
MSNQLDINQIIEEWKVDSVINESKLSHEIIRTPSLHATYLSYYVHFKHAVAIAKSHIGKMANKKRKYYRGECTKAELEKYDWIQYQGLKPSISELNSLLDYDVDMIYFKKELADKETAVQALEYVLKQIQQRDYTLKTLFEYNKYLNGA